MRCVYLLHVLGTQCAEIDLAPRDADADAQIRPSEVDHVVGQAGLHPEGQYAGAERSVFGGELLNFEPRLRPVYSHPWGIGFAVKMSVLSQSSYERRHALLKV